MKSAAKLIRRFVSILLLSAVLLVIINVAVYAVLVSEKAPTETTSPYDIAEKAEWKNLSDIKVDFPSVDYVGNQHYVFNIRGNNYRLIVVVKFTIGYIYVRWIGTHKDYDKIDCSTK